MDTLLNRVFDDGRNYASVPRQDFTSLRRFCRGKRVNYRLLCVGENVHFTRSQLITD
jgi:hypothetical protein